MIPEVVPQEAFCKL